MKLAMGSAVLISVLMLMQSGAVAEVIQLGANRLISLQNTDGGWDDPLDNGDRNASSPTDCVGQVGLGLVHAYLRTNNVDFKTAAQKAGALLLTKNDGFSACDGLFAKQLDGAVGGNTYSSHVKTNFYDALAAGGYAGEYDTASYVATCLESYPGKYAGWYLGMALASAKSVGAADTSTWGQGVKDALIQMDTQMGVGSYQTSDLAGSVYGLACAGESTFSAPLSGGPFSGISTLSALAHELAGLQLGSSGFKVDKALGTGSESVEATAYSILALSAVDAVTHHDATQQAQLYLHTTQLNTGGWQDAVGSGEANVVTGDALWSIGATVPEPSGWILLTIGGFGMLGIRRFCAG